MRVLVIRSEAELTKIVNEFMNTYPGWAHAQYYDVRVYPVAMAFSFDAPLKVINSYTLNTSEVKVAASLL